MKILVITDTHFGIKNDSPVFYDYMKISNQFMLSVIDKEGITEAIHLGDLFDRRKYVNFITANRCRTDLIEPLLERVNLKIIAGNHDVYYKDTNKINSLDEIVSEKYNNLLTHIEPVEVEYDGTKILLVPWISTSKEDQQKAFDAMNETKATICFGHFAIKGFQMDGGIVCEDGLEQDVFSRFEIVASGHFQHPMKLSNIHYLGAMYENNWSDYGDPRGFSVFDTDTRTFKFYRNPFTIYEIFRYNGKLDPNNIDYSIFTDKYVKVVVEDKPDPYIFDVFLDKISEAKPIQLSVDDIQPDDEEIDVDMDEIKDTQSLINSYIDAMNSELDSKRIKGLVGDLYKEAVSLESVE